MDIKQFNKDFFYNGNKNSLDNIFISRKLIEDEKFEQEEFEDIRNQLLELKELINKKDATNIILNTSTSLIVITDGGGVPVLLADAKWKVIITPYKLN